MEVGVMRMSAPSTWSLKGCVLVVGLLCDDGPGGSETRIFALPLGSLKRPLELFEGGVPL